MHEKVRAFGLIVELFLDDFPSKKDVTFQTKSFILTFIENFNQTTNYEDPNFQGPKTGLNLTDMPPCPLGRGRKRSQKENVKKDNIPLAR